MQRSGHWGPSGEFQETNKKTDDLMITLHFRSKTFFAYIFSIFYRRRKYSNFVTVTLTGGLLDPLPECSTNLTI